MEEEQDLIVCAKCGCPYFSVYGREADDETVVIESHECMNCHEKTEHVTCH